MYTNYINSYETTLCRTEPLVFPKLPEAKTDDAAAEANQLSMANGLDRR